MQPVTPKGTGYHRHVFVLYKQEKKINLEQFKVSEPNKLEQRKFNSFEFYKNLQDDITPAGLAFFQSKWEPSMTSFYHNVLSKFLKAGFRVFSDKVLPIQKRRNQSTSTTSQRPF